MLIYTCRFKELQLGNHTELNICSYELFFITSNTTTSKSMERFSLITCMYDIHKLSMCVLYTFELLILFAVTDISEEEDNM
jgi:hypothetical protein